MSEGADDKQFDPSQRRLDEARRQGDLPRSAELTSAAAWLGVLIAALLTGKAMVSSIGTLGAVLLGQADRLAAPALRGGQLPAAVAATLAAILPLFLIPMGFALLSLVAQRALVLAPDRLMPRLSRLSPLENARHKFGIDGLAGFLKSLLKMAAVSTVLGLVLSRDMNLVIGSTALMPPQICAMLGQLLIRFLALLCLIAAAFGLADFLWERLRFLRRNRMSRQEMADEMKDSDGDPHLRAHRRRRAREIATNRMLRDVPTADVVIVNPTHYAVALKWNRARREAPVCVAKGTDEIAARIRERAATAGVPVRSDPPTARALYAMVEIGAQIRPEHYVAIAAAIRFADRIRRHRKGMFR